MERWQEQQNALDFRAGLIVCAVLEPYRNRDGHPEPFSPREFFPNLPAPEPDPPSQADLNREILDEFFRGVEVMKKRGQLRPVPKRKIS